MTEVAPARDIDAARRRAERIRIKARTISEQYESLQALVDEAERNEDHLTLGYASWTAYLADLFGDEPLRLARDQRIPMSQMLAGKGMSTRAIGAVLGVDQKTVANDVRAGEEFSSPAPDPLAEEKAEGRVVKLTGPGSMLYSEPVEHIDYETGEILDETPIAQTVTGLDGKTYTRPAPNKPRRTPLPDAIWTTVYDMARKVERLERLVADDRLPQNRDKVAARSHSDLVRIIDALQRVADQINPNQE